MENRSKSSVEVCWALFWPLEVPYWRPWASWGRLGSVLGAFWSVLVAPWSQKGSPHGPPICGPKSFKNRSKISLFFWSIFRCDVDHQMITKWSPKHPFFQSKKWLILWSIFAPTWSQLGSKNVPNLRSKWCPRGYRRAWCEFSKNIKKTIGFSRF